MEFFGLSCEAPCRYKCFVATRGTGRPRNSAIYSASRKTRGDRAFNGVCRLMSHELGWELRLEIDDDLQRSAVCRSQDEILDTMEQWKAAMIDKGWQ